MNISQTVLSVFKIKTFSFNLLILFTTEDIPQFLRDFLPKDCLHVIWRREVFINQIPAIITLFLCSYLVSFIWKGIVRFAWLEIGLWEYQTDVVSRTHRCMLLLKYKYIQTTEPSYFPCKTLNNGNTHNRCSWMSGNIQQWKLPVELDSCRGWLRVEGCWLLLGRTTFSEID